MVNNYEDFKLIIFQIFDILKTNEIFIQNSNEQYQLLQHRRFTNSWEYNNVNDTLHYGTLLQKTKIFVLFYNMPRAQKLFFKTEADATLVKLCI
jgi:hypothetical protein